MYSVNFQKSDENSWIFQLYFLSVFFNNVGKNIKSDSCFPYKQDFITKFKILYISSYSI